MRRAVASRFVDTGRRRSTERRALARAAGLATRDVVEPPGVGLAPEVEAALALLAPRERACVVLRHMEDLSTRETAALLRLSEGAVKRYLSDGVAALTAVLDAEAGENVRVQQITGPGSGAAPRRVSTRKEVRHDA